MNKLRSNSAKLDIQGTRQNGITDIIIHNSRQRWCQTSAVFDNSGSGEAGKEMGSFSLGLDSPLFLNDYWNVSIGQNLKPESPGNQNRTRSVQSRLPFGYLQLSAFLSHFEYRSLVKGNIAEFESTGNTDTQNLSLEGILHRSRSSKSFLSYSNKLRRSENFIDDVLLAASSRTLRSQGLELGHNRNFEGGSMNLSLSYHKGGLSAVEGLSQASFAPNLEFEKLNLGLSYSLSFLLAKVRLNWKLSFQGQRSRHILFSGEQFGIGGLYSVRGFKEQSLSGDKGSYVRNELHWTPVALAQPKAWLLWGVPSIFLAYDMGAVSLNAKDSKGGQLEGAAIGFNHQSSYSQFSLTYSRSVHWAYLEREDALWLSLTIKY